MRIFNKRAILYYARKHTDARNDLLAWYADTETANWTTPKDVKARFPKASIIGNNRVVFNIKGGYYRLIVSFNYRHGAAYSKFFGTHREYDRVNAETIDRTGVGHE